MRRLSIRRMTVTVLSVAVLFPAVAGAETLRDGESFRYDGWERIKPKTAAVQYAGGIGLVSVGAGWQYGRGQSHMTEMLLGLLPRSVADTNHLTFTVKQTYTPWSVDLWGRCSLEPLGCGLFVTTIGGEEFWKREPGKYPSGYYGFTPKIRFSVFLSESITFYPRNKTLNAVSVYYELYTNDLYVLSKAPNRSISVGDILRLSLGVRLRLCAPRER